MCKAHKMISCRIKYSSQKRLLTAIIVTDTPNILTLKTISTFKSPTINGRYYEEENNKKTTTNKKSKNQIRRRECYWYPPSSGRKKKRKRHIYCCKAPQPTRLELPRLSNHGIVKRMNASRNVTSYFFSASTDPLSHITFNESGEQNKTAKML